MTKPHLLYLANLGCIDQNPYMAGWTRWKHPDFILIDLDPYHCGYDRMLKRRSCAGKAAGDRADGYPKTTGRVRDACLCAGGTIYTSAQTRSFAEILARG